MVRSGGIFAETAGRLHVMGYVVVMQFYCHETIFVSQQYDVRKLHVLC